MKPVKLLILIAFVVGIIAGCTGVTNSMKGGYKFEEVYSIGLFTPTYQYKKVSKCKTEMGVDKFGFPKEKTVEPCSPIGKEYSLDMSGPAAPGIISGASNVVTGAIIGEGLSDSGTSVRSIANTINEGSITEGSIINGNQHHGGGHGNDD